MCMCTRWISINVIRPIHGSTIWITDGKDVSLVRCDTELIRDQINFDAVGVTRPELELEVDRNNVTHWRPATVPSIEDLC